MLDKRQVELLLDRILQDDGDDLNSAIAWWREHGDEITSPDRISGRPVVDVCRSL